jgi:hypothetical protein
VTYNFIIDLLFAALFYQIYSYEGKSIVSSNSDLPSQSTHIACYTTSISSFSLLGHSSVVSSTYLSTTHSQSSVSLPLYYPQVFVWIPSHILCPSATYTVVRGKAHRESSSRIRRDRSFRSYDFRRVFSRGRDIWIHSCVNWILRSNLWEIAMDQTKWWIYHRVDRYFVGRLFDEAARSLLDKADL